MEVTFSEYIIQTGPGTKASDWRKNCRVPLPVFGWVAVC